MVRPVSATPRESPRLAPDPEPIPPAPEPSTWSRGASLCCKALFVDIHSCSLEVSTMLWFRIRGWDERPILNSLTKGVLEEEDVTHRRTSSSSSLGLRLGGPSCLLFEWLYRGFNAHVG